jgi:hypothetical protein
MYPFSMLPACDGSLLLSDQLPPYLEEELSAFVSLLAFWLWSAMGMHYIELDGIDEAAGLTLDACLTGLRRKVPFQFVGWTLTPAPPSRVSFE